MVPVLNYSYQRERKMNKIYPYSILIVEDEKAIRENHVTYLELLFENVYEACDGLQGYKVYKEKRPDIIIADINMPNMSGLELVEKIRVSDQQTKAIMLTAHTDKSFLLKATELKLNKYLTKPINRKLLKETLYETIQELQTYVIQKKDMVSLVQNYSWDFEHGALYYFNKQVNLTPKEKKFLGLLISSPQKIFSYEEISIHVWGYDETGSIDSIKTMVKKLRKKISHEAIENIFATGYRIRGLD